jgi:hypothetical protein
MALKKVFTIITIIHEIVHLIVTVLKKREMKKEERK